MPLALSHPRKKQQPGFTLIELMVVMAIIAILATAGLSAYTGYIKKARDATRIADINAINKIVIGSMSVNGIPLQTAKEVYDAVVAANNWTVLMDPLSANNGLTTKSVCISDTTSGALVECAYTFRTCDDGMGYSIGTRFESVSNFRFYAEDNMTIPTGQRWLDSTFEIGSCKNYCYYSMPAPPRTCPGVNPNADNGWVNAAPTKIDSSGTTPIGFPTP